MTAWFVVIAAGLGSYLFRVSMLFVGARRTDKASVLTRVAPFAMPTAFAALAATSLAHRPANGSALAPYAATVAAIIAVRATRSSHAALLAGLPVLWILSAVWR